MKRIVQKFLLFGVATGIAILILLVTTTFTPREEYTVNTLHPNTHNFRIGFGSCNRPDEPLHIWTPINQLAPNVWIWGGDIIYADSTDVRAHISQYKQLYDLPQYAQLRKSAKIIGTWDDHDYGSNDAGLEYPSKRESQQALLDFLNEPTDSPRRQQEGVYTSYKLPFHDLMIKVVLLDSRYFREKPGPTADILGKAQWDWLENVLTRDPSDITIIVSGIQVIPGEHEFEKWSNFPQSRERLLNLLHSVSSPIKIILSGDRHHAEISKISATIRENHTSEIYELTASGMTHSRDYRKFEPNPTRIGELYSQRNFGLIEVAPPISPEKRPSVTLSVFGVNGENVLSVHP
jgi:alkaline phosphatase D